MKLRDLFLKGGETHAEGVLTLVRCDSKAQRLHLFLHPYLADELSHGSLKSKKPRSRLRGSFYVGLRCKSRVVLDVLLDLVDVRLRGVDLPLERLDLPEGVVQLTGEVLELARDLIELLLGVFELSLRVVQLVGGLLARLGLCAGEAGQAEQDRGACGCKSGLDGGAARDRGIARRAIDSVTLRVASDLLSFYPLAFLQPFLHPQIPIKIT